MSSDRTIPPPGPSAALALAFATASDGRLRMRWTDMAGVHSVEVSRPTVFGSSDNVDVRVTNPTVSRVHAEINVDARGAWVRDLDSSNGTFVDRVEVKSARVAAGQTLRLGSAEIHVELVTPRVTPGVELWPEPSFGPLLGKSDAMRELFAALSRIARTDIPVLIRGETGSGKEVVGRAIHEASPRASGPYVVVDCAALSDNLLESELFGHSRGAFTGASAAREGAIEAADGGTVFLDEIGELPLDMQPKLLRVLEQRTVRRLGETAQRPVNVRFIAATHRDLVEFVARGWFREDLYFRLAVLPVRVPPLRERMEDLELLVQRFLGESAASLVTPALIAELGLRKWRGNVRELRNVLDRARAFGIGAALAIEEGSLGDPSAEVAARAELADAQTPVPATKRLPGDTATNQSGGELVVPPPLLALTHREFRERWSELGERSYLAQQLEKHGGNVSKVAREIELARTYAHKLIKKHGF